MKRRRAATSSWSHQKVAFGPYSPSLDRHFFGSGVHVCSLARAMQRSPFPVVHKGKYHAKNYRELDQAVWSGPCGNFWAQTSNKFLNLDLFEPPLAGHTHILAGISQNSFAL
jgi:hypothetical protein